jgi:hypothetical protein
VNSWLPNSKLLTARTTTERIGETHGWFLHVTVSPTHRGGGILHIDRRLLTTLSEFVGGELEVPTELMAHWLKACRTFGLPKKNPAQLELFLGPQRVPVFFATVDGSVYVSEEQMMPF